MPGPNPLWCSAHIAGAAPHATALGEPWGRGPHCVGSTNMQVAPEFCDAGDEVIHQFLLGYVDDSGVRRFVTDILKHPDSALITDVAVPDIRKMYGSASGRSLPVVTYVTYPSVKNDQDRSYVFPYHESKYGSFDYMLGAREVPAFAEPNKRYPLIILSHGASAHGIFDVKHAHDLASHGYIVAVINYGDDRTPLEDNQRVCQAFLRPLITKAVLDDVLNNPLFGGHIDTDNIGISGHSFGGFTALALAGGYVFGSAASVNDKRIKASVIAAPWVGGFYGGQELFAFGPDNAELSRVTTPVISFFGTKDKEALASFILPAMKKLSGPAHVVELVDQPHVFSESSWEDRNNWELLFFSAYLKANAGSLAALRVTRSMRSGGDNLQLFEY